MATKIVTRHKALVQVLKEDFNIVGEVIEHATPEQIVDNDIIGILPIPLAAMANSITVLNINVPQHLRGQELTVEQVRRYMDTTLVTYKVSIVNSQSLPF